MSAATRERPITRGLFVAARIAIVIGLAGALAVEVVGALRADQAAPLRTRDLEVARQARVLEGEAPEILIAARAYYLTLDPRFLERIEENRTDALDAIARLRALVDSEDSRSLVERVERALARELAGVDERAALARAGKLDEVRATLLVADLALQDLERLLDELVAREEGRLEDAQDDVRRERLLGIVAAALLLTGVGVAATLVLARSERALKAYVAGEERTGAQLATLNAALRAAAAARDAFIAVATHDLRTPLTAIRGFGQMSRRRLDASTEAGSQQVAGWLAQIGAAAERMDALLDDLSGSAGRLAPEDLRRTPTDLVALTQAATEEEQGAAGARTFRLDVERSSIVGLWDAMRLRRALANLLSNAVKYSPREDEIVVEVRAIDDGPAALIVITDRGLGIPADDLPHIFDPGRRGANVASVGGSGLGLASSRAIVAAHGGAITIESKVGEGTTVRVHLPLSGAGLPEE